MAQDSGGEAAAGKYYDAGGATYTTLIDVNHRVTALYQMVNVPTGVWIDEQGRIVRPPEVAYSKKMKFGPLAVGDDRYAEGLRDWVRAGEDSPYVVPAAELRAKLALRGEDRLRADAHFELAVHLHGLDRADEAQEHWSRAMELDPDNWNYHRQAWTIEGGNAPRVEWWKKVSALGERPYYEPADLPEEPEGEPAD